MFGCPTDDIEIIFRRGRWKANGEFAQTDVHRQIAIVFKTPPYEDQDIKEEVDVEVSLRRISDQMESESVTFTYLPCNRGQSGLDFQLFFSFFWLLPLGGHFSVTPSPLHVLH